MANEKQIEALRRTANLSFEKLKELTDWPPILVNDYINKTLSIDQTAITEDELILQINNNSAQVADLDGEVGQSRARAKSLKEFAEANLQLTVDINQMTARVKRMQGDINTLRQLLEDVNPLSQIQSLQKQINSLRSLLNDN